MKRLIGVLVSKGDSSKERRANDNSVSTHTITQKHSFEVVNVHKTGVA